MAHLHQHLAVLVVLILCGIASELDIDVTKVIGTSRVNPKLGLESF